MSDNLNSDPGLPVDCPSKSYWQEPPHRLSSIQSDRLPQSADVVIIGSGITGTSIAHHLLQKRPSLTISMLEARTVTSGATGRNGGHILDVPFADFEELKAHVGNEEAKQISKFRLSHLSALESLATSLGPDEERETQFRKVEAVCVIFDQESWSEWCKRRESWLGEFPEYRKKCQVATGSEEVEKKFGILNAAGALTMPAGAIWPYRVVTSVLERLLASHPDFRLETSTPATSISESGIASHPYAINTPRGTILATHVVHATNGHAAHLLPALRGKIIPVRGQMTVQKPTDSMPRRGNSNSWSLNYGGGDYDYIVQAPTPNGEFLLGGGLKKAIRNGTLDIGCTDDSGTSEPALKHLSAVLETCFDHGKDTTLEKQWTGIMGFTSDDLPIVGRIPPALGSVAIATPEAHVSEWIAAGFCGHGMVYTWLSGKALAEMLLGCNGRDIDAYFPRSFGCSEKRLYRLTGEDIYFGRRDEPN